MPRHERQSTMGKIRGKRQLQLLALAAATGGLGASVTADTAPKIYDCGDRKMEVFEPAKGIMNARIEDFGVEISVRKRSGSTGGGFSVTVTDSTATTTRTGAEHVAEALTNACGIVARYHKIASGPSDDDLAKQLSEFYEQL